jgi:hypothetical protein
MKIVEFRKTSYPLRKSLNLRSEKRGEAYGGSSVSYMATLNCINPAMRCELRPSL